MSGLRGRLWVVHIRLSICIPKECFPTNWQSLKLTCEVNGGVWHGWLQLYAVVFFLLLGCESQGKHGCSAVNAKSGLRSRCCLLPWKQTNKHLSAYWILMFIVNADTLCGWLLRVQPTSQTPGPWLCPSPFISGAMAFRVLTACLVSFICSCSSFPVLSLSLFPLPRSGWLSGRKIASFLAQDYPELWVPCNCPRPFLSLQPRRRVTDCWLRAPRCLLPNDCYKFW